MNKPINNTYNLSKDYKKLFELVNNGHKIACWVDYDYRRTGVHIIRDSCICMKKEYGDYDFGVRGMAYGDLTKYRIDNSNLSEEELFTKECERMNLEFIEPNFESGATSKVSRSLYQKMVEKNKKLWNDIQVLVMSSPEEAKEVQEKYETIFGTKNCIKDMMHQYAKAYFDKYPEQDPRSPKFKGFLPKKK